MKTNRGFSLLELIILLCIFAILIFLSIPFLRSSALIPFMDGQHTIHTSSETAKVKAIPIEENSESNKSLAIPLD